LNRARYAASGIVLALLACSAGCPSNGEQPGWSDDGGPETKADSTIPFDSPTGDVTSAGMESGADTVGTIKDSTSDSRGDDPSDASDSSTTADVGAHDAADAPAETSRDAGTEDGPADAASDAVADDGSQDAPDEAAADSGAE
jgi:hypothetical protein